MNLATILGGSHRGILDSIGKKAKACRTITHLEKSNRSDKTREKPPMEGYNADTPTAEQIEGFLTPDASGPIYMVNLLKFKEHAEYEDGRETSLSGREAYTLYATEVAKVITQVGGADVRGRRDTADAG